MEEKNMTVPYIAFEATADRAERRDKRNAAIITILVVLLVITNLAWIIAWNQYDYIDGYEAVDVSTEGNGNANYIGNDGEINNGQD